MPSNKDEAHKPTGSKKPIPATQKPLTGGNPPNSGEEEIRGANTTINENKPRNPRVISIDKIPKIDVIEGEEANRIATKANTISRQSVFVNAGLFVCTIILAGISIQQAHSSRDAAVIAKETLDSSKSYQKQAVKASRKIQDATDSFNTKMFKLQQDAYRSADTANRNTLAETKDYNNKLLNAQRDVLKETKRDAIKKNERDSTNLAETKKEFEIENSPFLEVVQTVIQKVEKGLPVIITFSYFNHSKLPAQVIISQCRIEWGENETVTPSPDTRFSQNKMNFYIANGLAQGFTAKNDSIPPEYVTKYNEGTASIFLNGSCEYVNPVTNKKFKYVFFERFFNKPGPGVESVISSVKEIK